MSKKLQILEAGAQAEPGKRYWLIETFVADVVILDDPYEVSEAIDESTGKTQLVERRKPGAKGPMKIRGLFQMEGVRNANKRIYPQGLWEKHLSEGSDLMKRVNERRVTGTIEHPESGAHNLDDSAILVTGLKMGQRRGKRAEVIGEAEILNTPKGQVLRQLIRDGVKVGISSRGQGTIDATGIVDSKTFVPKTWDIVGDPSTPGAYPTVVDSADLREGIDDSAAHLRSESRSTDGTPVNESSDGLVSEHANTASQGGPTMGAKEQFSKIETAVRPLLAGDLGEATASRLSDLEEALGTHAEDIAGLVNEDATLAPSAGLLQDKIKTRREAIAESLEQIDEMGYGKSHHGKKRRRSDDNEDGGDGMDESPKKLSEALALLNTARDELIENEEIIANLNEQIATTEAANDELIEALNERDDEVVSVYESLAASQALIATLTAVSPEADATISEAIESLIAEDESLEDIRPLLERAGSIEEVQILAERLGAKIPDMDGLPSLSESVDSSTSQTRTGKSNKPVVQEGRWTKNYKSSSFGSLSTEQKPGSLTEGLIAKRAQKLRRNKPVTENNING
jgi:hypothetical protein